MCRGFSFSAAKYCFWYARFSFEKQLSASESHFKASLKPSKSSYTAFENHKHFENDPRSIFDSGNYVTKRGKFVTCFLWMRSLIASREKGELIINNMNELQNIISKFNNINMVAVE